MERETRIIKTEKGYDMEIKTFFTQGERVQVTRIVSADTTIAGAEGDTKVNDLVTAQAKAVELALVSINGTKENAYNTLINELPASEYDAVSTEVMKMIATDLQTAK